MNWNRIESVSQKLTSVVLFIFGMLLALASAICASLGIMGAMQARAYALNDGISPTSMQSGNTPQAALTTHYNRVFMEFLKANFNKLRLCTRFQMTPHAGQVWRNFMMQALTANTTQQSEGTVGSCSFTFNVLFVGDCCCCIL